MSSTRALAQLRDLGVQVFATADAQALFGGTTARASKTLSRLAEARLLFPVRRGLWSLSKTLDPLALVESLSAPAPGYVSLQTALYRRGVIEQIPAVIYATTTGKPQRIVSNFGTFSIHRIAPELFGGFEVLAGGVKLATAEKALVDFLYLSGSRSRSFAALPEIELPPGFDVKEASRWILRIASPRLKTLVLTRWARWVEPQIQRRRPRFSAGNSNGSRSPISSLMVSGRFEKRER